MNSLSYLSADNNSARATFQAQVERVLPYLSDLALLNGYAAPSKAH